MNTVCGSQHIFDYAALGCVEKGASRRLCGRLFLRHNGIDGVLATHHVSDVCPFICDGLGRRKGSSGRVLPAFYLGEVSSLLAGVKLAPDMGEGCLSHPSPKGISHEDTLVGDCLALEVAIAGKSYSLSRLPQVFGSAVLSIS